MRIDLSFAEGLAVAAGVMQLPLAWLLIRHHRIRDTWGLNWIALALATGGILNALAPVLVTPNRQQLALSPLHLAIPLTNLVLGFASLAAMVVGIRVYAGMNKTGALKLFLTLWVLMPMAVMAMRGTGSGQFFSEVLATATLSYCAWLAFRLHHREPGAGNGVLSVALGLHPLTILVLAASGTDTTTARYIYATPYTLIGIVLLSVSINRLHRSLSAELDARQRAEDSLRQLNEHLEERVHARSVELEHAQRNLVHAETLASLGSLVAGVSHELSTPLGNARMMASTLADRQKALEAGMSEGLRRSALDAFLKDTREISSVVDRNLQRAVDLIGSFKQLAVDQSSGQRRQFALKDLVGEVCLALSPTLKQAGVQMRLDVADDISLDSFPGPLEQVLINLITNAINHGFDNKPGGTIAITARRTVPERVLIEVSDDGQGILPEHLPRIFDPFFTTRLGQGGSGLGLHIVHNLVVGPLGGWISVACPPGQGTRFSIDLPLRTQSVLT